MIGSRPRRRVAFLQVPGIGGPYRIYRELRGGLHPLGIEVRWLAVGPGPHALMERPEWKLERDFGAVLAPDTLDEGRQARILLDHLECAGYDGVFVNVLGDRVLTNIVRYLDPEVRRIMIVHSTTPGTYAAARAIRDYVHATIAVSPRISHDLALRMKFPQGRTHIVANAFGATSFKPSFRSKHEGPLRLLSLGRLEDASKGILWLPQILKQLRDVPLHLTVAGDGPDRDALQQAFAGDMDRVRFLGGVPPDGVPDLMDRHDILLFPSRYEGFGITLVEALAGGCVPVASHLRGVTDFVIESGKTGLLFPVGHLQLAAQFVRTLAHDRNLLARMSSAGRASAFSRFRPEIMAAAYADVLADVFGNPPTIAPVLRREDWSMPAGLRPGWRTILPSPIKNRLRMLRERLSSVFPASPQSLRYRP
jgi:glycosyltransferase involved in cell wall biosynthesis